MMHPVLQFAALSLLPIYLAAPSPVECPPADCGNLYNLSYPFWVEGVQHPSCGRPEFKLTCIDQSAQIGISNFNYTVKFIDKFEGLSIPIIVSPIDLESFTCLFLRSEFDSNSTHLFVPGNNPVNLIFWLNCSGAFSREWYTKVNCDQSNNSFAGFGMDPTDFGPCERFLPLPSAATWEVDKSNLTEILDAGFYMVVLYSDCSHCQNSGGKCRYNLVENRFRCLCGDHLFHDCWEMKGKRSALEKRHWLILGLTLAGAFVLLVFISFGYTVWKKMIRRNAVGVAGDGLRLLKNINAFIDKSGDLTHFEIATIALATKYFSPENKIGAGGFGDVYKGRLQDGQTIAVKRISFKSQERINEFMMEVKVIAKLQHRNLVKLIGCCIEGNERMLVYEFVPNKSLDFFIFGSKEKRLMLNWEMRLAIILGVARGLLYLHQDSRLRVIHRDLKAANILLEEDMNPKISDFGTARIFERKQIDDNTIKIVGTIGYMSPEYIMSGIFSEKSDIFSFGVLVIEILSGRRNKWISQKSHCMDLLSKAWILYMENQTNKLLDSALNHPTQIAHIVKFMTVGLLCIQEAPDDRPTMQEVVLMLDKENTRLPHPKKPGFFQNISLPDDKDSMLQSELTITTLQDACGKIGLMKSQLCSETAEL